MKELYEFLRKKFPYIIGIALCLIVFLTYLFFYNSSSDSNLNKILKTLNNSFVSTLIVAVIFGLFLYHLESKRGREERRLQQRLELRKRAVDCFEEINKLIIKIRFYKTSDSYNLTDISISFDQVANFFLEVQQIYKKLNKVIPNIEDIDKLDGYYQGWDKYFLFQKSEDLERLKKYVGDSEGYLECLKKTLINFIRTLELE